MSLKFLLTLIMGFAFFQVHAADGPAVHGMLMFGNKSVYLSHLPMFHNPHHYQGILKVEMGSEVEQKFFADQKANASEIYTYMPKPAVLLDIFSGKAQLKGDIYRGHFERGGVAILKDVTATIKKVVHFRKFDPQATRPKNSTYLLFGEAGDSWIAHYISLKPDFDHIASVETPAAQVPDLSVQLEIQGLSDAKPLEPMAAVNAHDSNGQNIKLENIKTKYLEFGDLEM